jgi:hypothetical protein
MKKLFAYSLLIALVFGACRKSDNSKLPDLIRVPTPNLVLDATSDKFISPASPATFKAKFSVDLKFTSDIPPKEMDLVVMKNGNKATIKTVKADITTFPTAIEVTGQQLIDLFGAPIADGDVFVFGVDITTQAGMVFQAFPGTGAGWGTGIANQAGGVTTSLTFIKPCTFVPASYAGEFLIVSDEWEDYHAGDVIEITPINATQFSFEYLTSPATPIVVTVNPADNSVSVPRQSYGKYGTTELFAQSTGTTNQVNPCDNSLTLALQHTNSTGGSYGTFTIRLKKKT